MGRTSTQFSKANPRPGPGRPKLSPEKLAAQRAHREAVKAVVYDYKRELAKLLPKCTAAVEKVLDRQKAEADGNKLRAVSIVENRIFGMPAQAITGSGGGPLVVSFTEVLSGVDGAKKEKL